MATNVSAGHGGTDHELSRRLTVFLRCLLPLGVAIIGLGVVWVRAMLEHPTKLGLALGPGGWVLTGITIRILLGWVMQAAPAQARVRSKARLVSHLAASAVLTVVSIVLIFTVHGPLGYQLFAGGVVFATGQVVLSLVFGLIDYMVIASRYAVPGRI